MKYAKRLWGYALEVLFPPFCPHCRAYIPEEADRKNLLCKSCFDGIPVYSTVFYNPRLSLFAVSSYNNEALRKLIHAYKYDRMDGAREPIKKLMDKYFEGVSIAGGSNTVIVPVPLHKRRQRQRGFNQSEFVAEELERILGFAVLRNSIKRVKDTPHQTTQESKSERAKSLRESFESAGESVKGKSVILVDDVYTTGATMNEAAKVLRKSGAKNVTGFVLAKTD